jgi:hypothetical protein
MDRQAVFRENRKATERLSELLEKLPDDRLGAPVTAEWNVKRMLAHLAFWDQRGVLVVESAMKDGRLHAPFYDDQLNDILAPVLDLIPAADVKQFALAVSRKLDALLENCPADILAEMEKVNPRLIDRSLHRNDHLAEIERAAALRG